MKLETFTVGEVVATCNCSKQTRMQRAEDVAAAPDPSCDAQIVAIESARADESSRAGSPGRSEVIAGLPAPHNATQAPGRAPLLIGERAHRFYFVAAQRVDYLEVDGNYVTIHVGADKYLTRTTLKHLSDVLVPYDFVRIDRSLLVNLRRVDYVERLESGQFAFGLRRGQRLVSSRERSGAIVRLLRAGVL